MRSVWARVLGCFETGNDVLVGQPSRGWAAGRGGGQAVVFMEPSSSVTIIPIIAPHIVARHDVHAGTSAW